MTNFLRAMVLQGSFRACMDADHPTPDSDSAASHEVTHTAAPRWVGAIALPLIALAVIGAAGAGSMSRALFPIEVLPAVHVTADAESAQPIATPRFDDEEIVELAADPQGVGIAEAIDFAELPAAVGDLIVKDGVTYRVDDVILMEVTAYCPCTRCCGPLAHGVTASGKPVEHNDGKFVAADIRVLPFDTEIRIPGYHGTVGDAVPVLDRGGAIRGTQARCLFPEPPARPPVGPTDAAGAGARAGRPHRRRPIRRKIL